MNSGAARGWGKLGEGYLQKNREIKKRQRRKDEKMKRKSKKDKERYKEESEWEGATCTVKIYFSYF